VHNKSAFSRPPRPLKADDCLWHDEPPDEEIHAAAARPGHVARVVQKIKALFPGLK